MSREEGLNRIPYDGSAGVRVHSVILLTTRTVIRARKGRRTRRGRGVRRFGELVSLRREGSYTGDVMHGCRYDVRTGKREDDAEGKLQMFPVAVRDGEIKIAVGVEEVEPE